MMPRRETRRLLSHLKEKKEASERSQGTEAREGEEL